MSMFVGGGVVYFLDEWWRMVSWFGSGTQSLLLGEALSLSPLLTLLALAPTRAPWKTFEQPPTIHITSSAGVSHVQPRKGVVAASFGREQRN